MAPFCHREQKKKFDHFRCCGGQNEPNARNILSRVDDVFHLYERTHLLVCFLCQDSTFECFGSNKTNKKAEKKWRGGGRVFFTNQARKTAAIGRKPKEARDCFFQSGSWLSPWCILTLFLGSKAIQGMWRNLLKPWRLNNQPTNLTNWLTDWLLVCLTDWLTSILWTLRRRPKDIETGREKPHREWNRSQGIQMSFLATSSSTFF